MLKLCTHAAVGLVAAATCSAQAAVEVSLGLREVGNAGATYPGLGMDGGTGSSTSTPPSNGIEWVNLDGLTLTLDGTWQLMIFSLVSDPITAFAGGSANGVLDGMWGTIEHIRIKNHQDLIGALKIQIDQVEVIDSTGLQTMQNFDTSTQQPGVPHLPGDEVMTHEPCFSGSTDQNFAIFDPAASPARCVQTPLEISHDSQVVDYIAENLPALPTANGGLNAYQFSFRFLPPTPPTRSGSPVTPGSRWARLTTYRPGSFALTNPSDGNPAVPFPAMGGTILQFWMRGEQGSAVQESGECIAVPHSMNGPVLMHTAGSAAQNDILTFDVTNVFGALGALLIGTEIPGGVPLDLIGGFPGSQLCVAEFANVSTVGLTSLTLNIPIGMTGLVGVPLSLQALDFDPNGGVPLPFGTSAQWDFIPGPF